jgi:hypothetical protein
MSMPLPPHIIAARRFWDELREDKKQGDNWHYGENKTNACIEAYGDAFNKTAMISFNSDKVVLFGDFAAEQILLTDPNLLLRIREFIDAAAEKEERWMF